MCYNHFMRKNREKLTPGTYVHDHSGRLGWVNEDLTVNWVDARQGDAEFKTRGMRG